MFFIVFLFIFMSLIFKLFVQLHHFNVFKSIPEDVALCPLFSYPDSEASFKGNRKGYMAIWHHFYISIVFVLVFIIHTCQFRSEVLNLFGNIV